MPTFKYNARDASGGSIRGELEVATRKLALQRLSAQGLKPVSIIEVTSGASSGKGSKSVFGSLRNTKASKVAPLTGKVALPFLIAMKELLSCGIQTGDALQLMSSRLSDPSQKLLANRLWEDVRQGRSLSEAFGKQSAVFDDSVVSLVQAGEATGSLNNVLTRLVSNMEETKAIKSKLFAALAYPCFLIIIACLLVLLFLFFLMPRIEGLLLSMGGNLPWSTKLLILGAESMLAYGWIVVLGVVLGVSSLVSWRKSPAGRAKFDELVLRIPELGRFLKELQVLRLTQVLALLLENGITMVQALAMSERSLSNRAMRERFSEARGKVTEGATLSGAFKATGYFDGMALDIFTVGESTGNIVPGLKQLVRQYGEKVDATIKVFIGVMSTGVLLFVFAFVGLVAFGIISAVLQMSSSLSG